MGDVFGQVLQFFLDVSSLILIPDWGELIGLIPTLVLIGVVGPVLSLLVLGWFIYVVRAPRRPLGPEPEARPAVIEHGRPVFPAGEPYCATHRLIHPFGESRCRIDHGDLALDCPKCGTGRPAQIAACGSCGLELRMTTRPARLAPMTPPPGGAAAA